MVIWVAAFTPLLMALAYAAGVLQGVTAMDKRRTLRQNARELFFYVFTGKLDDE